jgi:putative spermidine/putrescine transport system ATP-binding protein
MAGLVLSGIEKKFGAVVAVSGVDLALPNGKFVCFLGPSGCGKTTLLRIIAGLEMPTSGSVVLDGENITGLPAHKRNFGMVFQSFALFPHLNVADNIAYGLRVRGVDKERQRRRVEELLELVQLPGVAQRRIDQLSGGQRQRVAIGRALALDPKLFLLDEPLSALDAKLREAMQIELKLLQQRLGITTILVTHDQREAMTMADLAVVMGDNRVQQVGPPLEIYRRPANRFVADFIGTSNLLSARVAGPGRVAVGERELAVPAMAAALERGREVTLSVRPEDVHVLPAGAAAENLLPGKVVFLRDVGASVETHIDCAGVMLIAIATPKERPEVRRGDAVAVQLPPAACVVLAE